MPSITPELLQTSALAIILLFTLKEMFAYFKSKKPNGSNINKDILGQLELTNTNHLIHITESIEKLNCTIRDGNEKMIALLSEIKGQLSK